MCSCWLTHNPLATPVHGMRPRHWSPSVLSLSGQCATSASSPHWQCRLLYSAAHPAPTYLTAAALQVITSSGSLERLMFSPSGAIYTYWI